MKKQTLILLVALFSSTLHAAAQGSLTPPPGAPAPVMKSLDQVEARTPLDPAAADTSAVLTSNSSYQLVILKPGSYYLTANLDFTKANGISIQAAGVTLDLNGFTITRSATPSGSAVHIAAGIHGVSIRNGVIERASQGIFNSSSANTGGSYSDLIVRSCTGDGIRGGSGSTYVNCRVHQCATGIIADGNSNLRNCTVSNCTGSYGIYAFGGSTLDGCVVRNCDFTTELSYGIFLYQGSAASRCTVTECTLTYGYFLSGACTLEQCIVANNTVASGITAGEGGKVLGCLVTSNTSAAGASSGIQASAGCLVEGCTVRYTLSTAVTLNNSTGTGIYASGAIVRNCNFSANRGAGIRIADRCTLTGNHCIDNGQSTGNGAGIVVNGGGNRIEGNQLLSNDRGLEVTGTGNLIIGNSASGNTTNYEIVSGNKVGFIVAAPNSGAISGSTGGSGVGTTNSWDNISF